MLDWVGALASFMVHLPLAARHGDDLILGVENSNFLYDGADFPWPVMALFPSADVGGGGGGLVAPSELGAPPSVSLDGLIEEKGGAPALAWL